MEQLLEALVVEELELNLSLDDALQDKLTPFDVIECCKSLVLHEISSDLVRFSHFTVQEFIDKHAEEILPPVTHIARACLAYLDSPEFNLLGLDRITLREKLLAYKFSSYASQFWADHIRGEAESCPVVQLAFVSVFGSREKTQAFLLAGGFDYPTMSRRHPVLVTAVRFGLVTICRLILHGDLDDMYFH